VMQDILWQTELKKKKKKKRKKKKILFSCKLNLNVRQNLVKCNRWSTDFYGADTWVLQKADEKLQEGSEALCLRKLRKVSRTYRVTISIVQSQEENKLRKTEQRKDKLGSHTLHRRSFLKQVDEGQGERKRRRRRKHKQLLDYLKEERRYWDFKQESLDRIRLRTSFNRGYRLAARQTTW